MLVSFLPVRPFGLEQMEASSGLPSCMMTSPCLFGGAGRHPSGRRLVADNGFALAGSEFLASGFFSISSFCCDRLNRKIACREQKLLYNKCCIHVDGDHPILCYSNYPSVYCPFFRPGVIFFSPFFKPSIPFTATSKSFPSPKLDPRIRVV